MSLVLTEEQIMLRDMARQFISRNAPVRRIRELRESQLKYSPELWTQMAGLGLVGVNIPEPYGGTGMGFFELALVIEEMGRQIMPEPMLSTIVLGAQALMLSENSEICHRWLSRIATGNAVVSVAFREEHSRFDLFDVKTSAEKTDTGWRLSGAKVQVLDAEKANLLLVPAATDDGQLIIIALDPSLGGVEITPQSRVDSRGAAIVRLDGVEVRDDTQLVPASDSRGLLAEVYERATVAWSAEMLGAGQQAFEITLEYLQERVQFGVPIGSFQALQHRAARMFIAVETARSAVWAAAWAVDNAPARLAMLASLAKAKCNEMLVHVTNEGVQMFGGVGMTDEYDIGLYMKRARAAAATFGDEGWHRNRWAELRGY